MKGLLVKDICLGFQNRKSILIYLMCSLFMAFSMDGSFIIGYTAMLMAMIALGTVAYDEADNGYPFLMSLPVDRKTYVREKFLYCFLTEGIGIVFGLFIYIITSLIKGQPVELVEGLLMVIGMVLMMSVIATGMIAIEIRYGSQKSRTALALIYGGLIMIAVLIRQIDGAGAMVLKLIEMLEHTSTLLIFLILTVVTVLVEYLIYRFAVWTMEKKEF